MHIPLGVLAEACAESKLFEWSFSKQHTLEAAKAFELLARVETMLCHQDILQGANFIWVTDHKSLGYILTQ